MFRKLAAVSVVTFLAAASPAVLVDQGYSHVALDLLPDGDRFAEPECRPSYRTEVC